ncbi:MAG: dTDP-4-dehydrorhamnose reductase [Candidatus Marinimicrobia bacterium]|nr:dTDP-4-dehydrorhamnose reductase [Candidatus Neomarinimicrobiota bacterium]
MSKRILITGAFGQLGEAVIRELQPHFDLLATDIQIVKTKSFLYQVKHLDITSRPGVMKIVKNFNPEIIINMAAYIDVDGCETNREIAWNVNVRGVEYLLEAIRRKKTRIIHISSDYIFNGENGPYKEKDIPNPINYYGKTKLASENAIRGSANPWVILRTNVLYGSSTRSRASFVNWVVTSLRQGKEITVVDDQIGNPTWTGGLAEAIKMAILLNVRGIFNYGGAEFLSRFQFAQKIANVFECDKSSVVPVSTDDLNQIAQRPLKSGLITNKIEDILGLRTYEVEYCLQKIKED